MKFQRSGKRVCRVHTPHTYRKITIRKIRIKKSLYIKTTGNVGGGPAQSICRVLTNDKGPTDIYTIGDFSRPYIELTESSLSQSCSLRSNPKRSGGVVRGDDNQLGNYLVDGEDGLDGAQGLGLLLPDGSR